MQCVKCGETNVPAAPACAACSWPFTRPAWKSTSFWIRRITLDSESGDMTGAELATLERWSMEGKITLHASNALADAAMSVRHLDGNMSRSQPSLFASDTDLAPPAALVEKDLASELGELLFPTTAEIASSESNIVEHLARHVVSGADVFVTLNVNDFALHGRSDELSRRGIWVMTPQEIVGLMRELYEWE